MKIRFFALSLFLCAPCVASEDASCAAAASSPFADERAAVVQYFRKRLNLPVDAASVDSADQLHEKISQLISGIPDLMNSFALLDRYKSLSSGYYTSADWKKEFSPEQLARLKNAPPKLAALKLDDILPELKRGDATDLAKAASTPLFFPAGLSSLLNDLATREADAVTADGGKQSFIEWNLVFPAVMELLEEARALFPDHEGFKYLRVGFQHLQVARRSHSRAEAKKGCATLSVAAPAAEPIGLTVVETASCDQGDCRQNSAVESAVGGHRNCGPDVLDGFASQASAAPALAPLAMPVGAEAIRAYLEEDFQAHADAWYKPSADFVCSDAERVYRKALYFDYRPGVRLAEQYESEIVRGGASPKNARVARTDYEVSVVGPIVMELLREAADAGNLVAMRTYGMWYWSGNRPWALMDKAIGYPYLKAAAEAGDGTAREFAREIAAYEADLAQADAAARGADSDGEDLGCCSCRCRRKPKRE